MVKVISRSKEDFDFTEVPLALTSNDFNPRFGHEVIEAGARKYALRYDDGPNGLVGTYSGQNMRYGEITLNGKTLEAPRGGKVTGYSEGANFSVEFSISASTFFKVSRTASDADNIALFNRLLNRKNEFRLGDGDDVVDAGKKADIVFGGGGEDILMGGGGSDEINGQGGNDLIEGGKGNDDLTGGGGADTFIYEDRKQGRDVIEDFGRRDTVQIDQSLAANFEELRVTTVQGDGAVRFAGTTVIFDGLDREDIDQGMFDFV